MIDLAYSLLTVLTLAGLIVFLGYLVHRQGPSQRLGRRGVDWATSLGISIVLSFVAGLILTTMNVGFGVAFPAAFLRSFAVGLLVSTPTAYVVVPRVRGLVARLAAPTPGDDPGPPP